MLLEAFDRPQRIVLWLHAPPFEPGDFRRHRDRVRAWVRDPSVHGALAVLVLHPDAPAPSPTDRRDTFEVLRTVPPSVTALVVTPSALLRGALTAVRWLGSGAFDLQAVGDFDEASQWALTAGVPEGRIARARDLARALAVPSPPARSHPCPAPSTFTGSSTRPPRSSTARS